MKHFFLTSVYVTDCQPGQDFSPDFLLIKMKLSRLIKTSKSCRELLYISSLIITDKILFIYTYNLPFDGIMKHYKLSQTGGRLVKIYLRINTQTT